MLNYIFSAPKLTSEFALIHWHKMSATQVYNLNRAVTGILVPYCFWKNTPVKLYEIQQYSDGNFLNQIIQEFSPGYVEYYKTSKKLRVLCANNSFISVGKVGVYGKKVMSATDFFNGFLSKVPPAERYLTSMRNF